MFHPSGSVLLEEKIKGCSVLGRDVADVLAETGLTGLIVTTQRAVARSDQA